MSELAGAQCGDEPHLHDVFPQLFLFRGQGLFVDRQLVALIPHGGDLYAARIVELLARHGLVDVPDTPSEVACPWPPPDPQKRLAN